MQNTSLIDIAVLAKRERGSHKGDYGRVLVVGGSQGMLGAPALAAFAALRSGAGLVTIATPAPIQPFVATMVPCATTMALPEYEGVICPHAALATLQQAIITEKRFDVVAIGPGLSISEIGNALIPSILDAGIPCVIDADALNALARTATTAAPKKLIGPCVLTPHPGEMTRLLNTSTASIQSDRSATIAMGLDRWIGQPSNNCSTRGVILLKGAGTLVCDGEHLYTNGTGNPGMATGGSGDVLTGVIAALIGQGLSTFDAACLGAHIHGLAGDLAASRLGETSIIASDLIDHLPEAFRSVG